MSQSAQALQVQRYLMGLQDRICQALEGLEEAARFECRERALDRGGSARPRVLEGGAILERAAVHFSHTFGKRLPASATLSRPLLVDAPFEAVSLSLIVHPRNPHAPTVHMNLRYFVVSPAAAEAVWWFGGGFDLTPIYGYFEDAQHWHANAAAAAGPERYEEFKQACDRYFFLPHRQETRGIGGLFFDDYSEGGFSSAFELVRRVGDAFLPGYLPILHKRAPQEYGEAQRAFQRYRRGRYVEFNLLYDRGTQHGLQAGGPAESILSSLPPEACWRYDWTPAPGTAEATLREQFLRPRAWLAEPSAQD